MGSSLKLVFLEMCVSEGIDVGGLVLVVREEVEGVLCIAVNFLG